MNQTNGTNRQGQQQLVCPKHQNSNILFICSVQNCKENRKICEQCKLKQSLHISYHSNYIFKIKQFFDFNQSKLVIPKLQKGLQDLQTFINKHKQFYKEQAQKISADFDLIIKKFIETTNQYKKIFLENFEKEITSFDNDFAQITTNLKAYANEKSHQESFFTKLFANDKNTNDIEDIIQKNAKGFEVRASIMTLKSKVTNSKVAKTVYKSTQSQEAKFNQLMGVLETFSASFYEKFKDLLASNSQNVPSSPQKNNLKQSIVSQVKSLSMSKVSSQNFDLIDLSLKKSSTTSSQKVLEKCILPDLHPKVAQIKRFLKPFPNFTQTQSKQQGPFKYQTGAYYGNYENGVRSGKGIFVYDDGSFYEGNWQNDNMSGYGRLIKPSSYYEGDIRDGFAHGKGNYQDFQKTYSGEWRNDLRHGLGQQEFKNRKRRYIGSFVSDKYQGRGKLHDQDFIYEGEFKTGLFQGQGFIKYKNGEIFKGSFKENQRVFGRHTFPDGSYYEGKFRDNMPDGNGQFYWPDGIKYVGQWKNGLQQGVGIETLANGKQLKGFWQNGVWVKWI